MLQTVHQNPPAPRASSLIYCRWIRESRNEGTRLVAVWIDREMRCFEKEFTPNSELVPRDTLEEPGGSSGFPSLSPTAVIGIATCCQ
jgi:hypothetical protein